MGGQRTAKAKQSAIDHDTIARRAYQIFVSRGCTDGHDVEDWLAAETQLQQERAGKAKPATPGTPRTRSRARRSA
ncbi:MAG: DUF2934 domain-containing protein [Dehalococcoidia bacterium]